jgi:hypothetical protein
LTHKKAIIAYHHRKGSLPVVDHVGNGHESTLDFQEWALTEVMALDLQ